MTYGVGLVIFLITGIVYLLAMGVVQANYYASGTTMAPDYSWIGFILGLNPAGALISIFEPSFSDSIFLTRWGSQQAGAPIQLWQEFLLVYSVVIILALWLAIRYIRPVRRARVKKRLQTDWEPQEHEQAEK